jgi:uncharacterized membrane protein
MAIQALYLLLGLASSIYLTYASLASVSAIDSAYGEYDLATINAQHTLVGIPYELLGLFIILVLTGLFVARVKNNGQIKQRALFGMTVVSVAGLVLSWYWTYVDLVVLQVVCNWCLAFAFATTMLAYLSAIALRDDASSWL